MRKAAFVFAVAALLTLLSAGFASAQGMKFTGEVMDRHCAEMGSHQMTMMDNKLTTPLQCTLYCLHFRDPHSTLVLYDAKTKAIYDLDDQDRAIPYSAEKVEITGTLDKATKKIHVMDIKAIG